MMGAVIFLIIYIMIYITEAFCQEYIVKVF